VGNIGDGTRIPVTIVGGRDMRRDDGTPMVLYGYGACERAADLGFSISRLSLLDRGVA
jgi:oligopeptidase B